jgi:capsular polysaccharide biosynthesis protein
MRPETEPRPRPARAVPELDAEREVDLGRYGRSIAARWWLVLLAIVVGVLVGYLFSSTVSSDVNRAQATIYLGQALSATGNSQVPTLATNLTAVREIARSDELVESVAGEVGISPANLGSGISTSQVTGSGARQDQSQSVFTVSVRGSWGGRTVARATNLLAAAIVERTSGYVDTKIDALGQKLDGIERELASIERRIDDLQASVSARDLSPTERLILISLIGFAEDRRFQLVEDRTDTELVLNQARTIERGQVVTDARSAQVTPRSSRSSMVVGGLLGLIAGIVLALAWEPIVRRRRLRVSTT